MIVRQKHPPEGGHCNLEHLILLDQGEGLDSHLLHVKHGDLRMCTEHWSSDKCKPETELLHDWYSDVTV